VVKLMLVGGPTAMLEYAGARASCAPPLPATASATGWCWPSAARRSPRERSLAGGALSAFGFVGYPITGSARSFESRVSVRCIVEVTSS
jgi:hypothetical protein